MPLAEASRLHPSRWSPAIWVALSLLLAFFRVDYTLGAFSFAPAFALLGGTWLGSLRGATVQAVTGVMLLASTLINPAATAPGEWGFRLGLIAAAALAGRISPADARGAVLPRSVRFVLFGAVGGTAALAFAVIPRVTSGDLTVVYGLTFVLALALAVFYTFKMVAEPVRVAAYFVCMMPYYAIGVAGSMVQAGSDPSAAAADGAPIRLADVLFHGYLSHLPGELISLVVIAYVVCAVEGGGATETPAAIGASR